jgi:hypothetical protein
MRARDAKVLRSVAGWAAAGVLLLAGCGGDDDSSSESTSGSGVRQEPEAAANPQPGDFPAADGRTLQQLADLSRPGTKFGLATSHYVPGTNRLAFGLLDGSNTFVYAPTAVYVAPTPNDPAEGPYLAPSDSLVTEPAFRSKQAALEGDAIAAIYSSEIELPAPGRYAILALTRAGGELFGATSQIAARPTDSIPAVGERPPPVETDTLEDSGGDISSIDTREPPSDMHEVSFDEVVGEQPVALLFATPALCQSRVCGPVTDIAVQLKEEYGDQAEFIHQEVWVDNDLGKGLRPPLRAFNLRTEPWLFTVDADGRVAARLEGSFGVNEFEQALHAAL